jgi:hypothetical protein
MPGRGRRTLDAAHAAVHQKAALYLIAAPVSLSYYEHIGTTRHNRRFAFLPATRISSAIRKSGARFPSDRATN